MIGKSVETALLARIADDARGAGAASLTAEFIDSGRNQVASTFLAGHGFAAGPETDWSRQLGAPGLEWPEWIEPAALSSRTERRPSPGGPRGWLTRPLSNPGSERCSARCSMSRPPA